VFADVAWVHQGQPDLAFVAGTGFLAIQKSESHFGIEVAKADVGSVSRADE
jgi:hypothetical protein